jgi:hypothetical protein
VVVVSGAGDGGGGGLSLTGLGLSSLVTVRVEGCGLFPHGLCSHT